MIEFFKKIIGYFDLHNIPYMLSGSIAMGIYVVPRATRDIDFVVNLQPKDIPELIEYFKGDYYLSETAVKDAIDYQSMFNVIDHVSGYKANFVILKDKDVWLEKFQRRNRATFFGSDIFVPSVEDIDWTNTIMQDTPENIKKKQLEIWLAKPLEERLRLTLQMNDELNEFWTEVKKNMPKKAADNVPAAPKTS